MEDIEGLFDEDELTFLYGAKRSTQKIVLDDSEDIVKRIEQMNEIINRVHREFPPVPKQEHERLMHYLYYAALCCLFSDIKGPDFDWTPQANESEAIITEKAIGMYLDEMYRAFIKISEHMGDHLFEKIEAAVYKRFPDGHPVLDLMELINVHKELHSRRIKADPCLPRTKAEIAGGHQAAINIVTQEVYTDHPIEEEIAPENLKRRTQPWKLTEEEIAKLPETARKHHSSWKMLIISPLPSDTDENAVDPVYRSQEEEMLHNIDVIQNMETDVESYGIMVTDDWDKLLRTLHGACHFPLYLHDRMVDSITPKERSELTELPWKQVWKRLAGPYANKRITELTGNKKSQPDVIVSLMELRDFVQFLSLFQ